MVGPSSASRLNQRNNLERITEVNESQPDIGLFGVPLSQAILSVSKSVIDPPIPIPSLTNSNDTNAIIITIPYIVINTTEFLIDNDFLTTMAIFRKNGNNHNITYLKNTFDSRPKEDIGIKFLSDLLIEREHKNDSFKSNKISQNQNQFLQNPPNLQPQDPNNQLNNDSLLNQNTFPGISQTNRQTSISNTVTSTQNYSSSILDDKNSSTLSLISKSDLNLNDKNKLQRLILLIKLYLQNSIIKTRARRKHNQKLKRRATLQRKNSIKRKHSIQRKNSIKRNNSLNFNLKDKSKNLKKVFTVKKHKPQVNDGFESVSPLNKNNNNNFDINNIINSNDFNNKNTHNNIDNLDDTKNSPNNLTSTNHSTNVNDVVSFQSKGISSYDVSDVLKLYLSSLPDSIITPKVYTLLIDELKKDYYNDLMQFNSLKLNNLFLYSISPAYQHTNLIIKTKITTFLNYLIDVFLKYLPIENFHLVLHLNRFFSKFSDIDNYQQIFRQTRINSYNLAKILYTSFFLDRKNNTFSLNDHKNAAVTDITLYQLILKILFDNNDYFVNNCYLRDCILNTKKIELQPMHIQGFNEVFRRSIPIPVSSIKMVESTFSKTSDENLNPQLSSSPNHIEKKSINNDNNEENTNLQNFNTTSTVDSQFVMVKPPENLNSTPLPDPFVNKKINNNNLDFKINPSPNDYNPSNSPAQNSIKNRDSSPNNYNSSNSPLQTSINNIVPSANNYNSSNSPAQIPIKPRVPSPNNYNLSNSPLQNFSKNRASSPNYLSTLTPKSNNAQHSPNLNYSSPLPSSFQVQKSSDPREQSFSSSFNPAFIPNNQFSQKSLQSYPQPQRSPPPLPQKTSHYPSQHTQYSPQYTQYSSQPYHTRKSSSKSTAPSNQNNPSNSNPRYISSQNNYSSNPSNSFSTPPNPSFPFKEYKSPVIALSPASSSVPFNDSAPAPAPAPVSLPVNSSGNPSIVPSRSSFVTPVAVNREQISTPPPAQYAQKFDGQPKVNQRKISNNSAVSGNKNSVPESKTKFPKKSTARNAELSRKSTNKNSELSRNSTNKSSRSKNSVNVQTNISINGKTIRSKTTLNESVNSRSGTNTLRLSRNVKLIDDEHLIFNGEKRRIIDICREIQSGWANYWNLTDNQIRSIKEYDVTRQINIFNLFYTQAEFIENLYLFIDMGEEFKSQNPFIVAPFSIEYFYENFFSNFRTLLRCHIEKILVPILELIKSQGIFISHGIFIIFENWAKEAPAVWSLFAEDYARIEVFIKIGRSFSRYDDGYTNMLRSFEVWSSNVFSRNKNRRDGISREIFEKILGYDYILKTTYNKILRLKNFYSEKHPIYENYVKTRNLLRGFIVRFDNFRGFTETKIMSESIRDKLTINNSKNRKMKRFYLMSAETSSKLIGKDHVCLLFFNDYLIACKFNSNQIKFKIIGEAILLEKLVLWVIYEKKSKNKKHVRIIINDNLEYRININHLGAIKKICSNSNGRYHEATI
ncbi:uncharacterized protein ASCRUDRAFT_70795 [Ascoidea rubescens DSM 1968]|uniref:Rho-GAP domain-containing protein n=1 Tax=Ascoidea rubescens DSM 1968 TaxID=1344418 RepID=A0A1D2VFK7_9ASCO|nr:hypothetical protein ASCRUDRAFT_70795 [Ascoidea rubescens DSM 1968]ODV60257.1 hypothetical protein ASCRUDRAFT_70795 [Ascoidea rubescens DSM 1968]